MELRVLGGQLKLGSAFRLIAIGYGIGAGVISIPIFAIASLLGAMGQFAGAPVSSIAGGVLAFAPLIMLPVILGLQSLMIGGLVVFGLWVYRKWRPLQIVGYETFD